MGFCKHIQMAAVIRCFAAAGPTLYGTVCMNSFGGNRTSPSDNSNDRWKHSCLVSWAAGALCL